MVIGRIASCRQPAAAEALEDRPLPRVGERAPGLRSALANVVPVQEGRRVADLRVGRALQIDAGFLQSTSQRLGARLVRFVGVYAGDPAGLALVEPDAEMTCQLDDTPGRVGEQVFVALNKHVGLCHPEPIVGENLMDHPLAEQLLERHSSFMHQRKDHFAHVAIGINRHALVPRPARGRTIGLLHAT